ncbi:HepT-like ribonuclease domain-containing protein [Ornithinimicrobium sufpigmenti]|uniref:HepT-like ribonuclease domain-containing protein n=1 Tax=Ornithinimicrobium sufpigmenti TaxID=2508882 RepID=UPI0010368469|nr:MULTISPECIES: DUF86 domain-containing protein [unclassified Ornithinimicrobium]
MSRSEQERFTDILHAIERCQNYTQHLDSEDLRAMAYDAVLRNLAVIGEAVRALPSETRDRAPEVPWGAIAGLRNVVVHEYFRIDAELILDIVDNQLGPLADRLRQF